MKSHMVSRTNISTLCASLALVVAGCGNPDPNDGNEGAPGSGGNGTSAGGSSAGGSSAEDVPACASRETILASSASNISFWSAVTLPNLTQVAPVTELTFDWSAVTTDFLGNPVDPAQDIVLVTIALWQMTPDEFATRINDDTLGSPAVAAFLQTEGQVTQTGLFALTPPAGPIPEEQMLSFFDIDAYPPGDNFYTLLLGSDLTPGMNTRMIGGFELNAASTNTEVRLDDDSTKLEYDVDFSESQPTLVPAGVADLTIDWSGMETLSTTETDPTKLNAAGLPFLKRSIKQVKVASYTQTEAELKQKETILRLDDLADATYIGDVASGSAFNLAELVDANGNPFAGIDATHTWVLALVNTDSMNPAPWYLTFLKECR